MRAETCDAIVLGGGAAGLMAALIAGQRGCRVAVIEHNAEPGRKILISGGGRCNFTHMEAAADRYLSASPHFIRSALARYTPRDFLKMVEKHRIAWHEKTPGQLFCSSSARDILSMLLDECAAGGVGLYTGERITDVSGGEIFRVTTTARILEAPSLVIATGGLSIPKMGASGFGLTLAARFGLPVIPTAPGLVPLVFDGAEDEWMHALAGTSLPVMASFGKKRFTDGMVFTHRGLSGPAILQISSWIPEGESFGLDLLPGYNVFDTLRAARRERPRAGGISVLNALMPERLARVLAPRLLGTSEAANWSDKTLRAAEAALKQMRLLPSGTEGYAKAEVMTGGVDTRALSSQTMEARDVPGLYVVGEAVDVTGWLGGYNFQWAWSGGHAAGLAIAARTHHQKA
ncbi:NAD(P)/FAD-dependent oxidoreductase [Acetobacter sp. AN02]|uniref:NAD(P)/FAD-dependent oxidoreductase n=1 Tax=Acetobacter sp. AN02 TaxID=2894186 RepID=UPI0024342600|nr:aminoacetone oxidase family FAD-binding enzyme [Acetobacter sp. AN02]MDG6094546.1 NAD(P)/FAD-dependent oxidoreductase [Acetobacter sp. AN02]